MADITVVTVEYGNPADTAALAASLSVLDGADQLELVVVDNHGSGGVIDLALPFATRRLSPGRNLYYWGGAAFAIDALRGDGGTIPDWLIVCNNDISIENRDFLKVLTSMDRERNPIIAPSIISSFTGKDQNPMFETAPTFLRRTKWRLFDSAYPVAQGLLAAHDLMLKAARIARPRGGRPERGVTPRQVYAAHGACVIFSAAFFKAGGSLDTTVPMFAEELTLAEEAKRLGLAVSYRPDLLVKHREHSTTGAGLTRPKFEMQRSAHRHYFSLRNRTPAGLRRAH